MRKLQQCLSDCVITEVEVELSSNPMLFPLCFNFFIYQKYCKTFSLKKMNSLISYLQNYTPSPEEITV